MNTLPTLLAKIDLKWLVILILIIIIILLRTCSGGNTVVRYKDCPPPSEIVTKVYAKGDTVFQTLHVRPKPPYIIFDTFQVIKPADTLAILADYLKRKVYVDTLRDSNYVAIINDTIAHNERTGLALALKNLRPTAITNNIVTYDTCPKPRFKVAIGGELGGNANQFIVGPRIMFITKKNVIINCGFDYYGRFTARIGSYWVIKLKK